MHFEMIKDNLQTYKEWNRVLEAEEIFLDISSVSAFQSLVFGLNPHIWPLNRKKVFIFILHIRVIKEKK